MIRKIINWIKFLKYSKEIIVSNERFILDKKNSKGKCIHYKCTNPINGSI